MQRSLAIMIVAVVLLTSSCVSLTNQVRSTTEPTLVTAVFTSGLNPDGSPIDERIVFSPYEKIYLSVYVKNAIAKKTVIKMHLPWYLSPVTKYLTATRDGDQYIGIDTEITAPFKYPALGAGEYLRMKIDQTIIFSFVTPSDGVILIDELPIIVAE